MFVKDREHKTKYRCDSDALWERHCAIQGTLPLIDALLRRCYCCFPFTVSETRRGLPSLFVSLSAPHVNKFVLHLPQPLCLDLGFVSLDSEALRHQRSPCLFSSFLFFSFINSTLKIEQKMIVSCVTKPTSSVDCQPTPLTVCM